MSRIISAIFAWAALSALVLQAQPLTNGVALAYFAPESQLFYRLRYPGGAYREFQRSFEDLTRMDGAAGWRARFAGGGKIVVRGPGEEGPETYVFDRGRLVSFKSASGTETFDYHVARIPPEDEIPPFHFGSAQEKALSPATAKAAPKTINDLFKRKWRKSGRLDWPFQNPNESGFLYASLVLLSLALAGFRRRVLRIAGFALGFVFFIPLTMTASRGALLALAMGLLPLACVHAKALLKSRWTYVAAALVIGFATVWFGLHDPHILTRGSRGKSAWSNEIRLTMWKMSVPMMADAPGGWQINPGKAFADWYEDVDAFVAPGSLMNDHLSKMVRVGWPLRALYVFVWSSLFLGFLFIAVKTKRAIPAGMVLAAAVACWFNPLMINKWLWIAPGLAAATVLFDRPWREGRRWLAAVGGGLAVTVAVIGTIVVMAERTPRPYGVRVSVDGPRVCVQQRRPGVWVVDDGRSIGGAFVGKEIRSSLVRGVGAGIGYVRHCEDLPQRGVRRLILAGDAGDEWLKAVCSDASRRENLPQDIVFLSPPFPPSAIPPPLFDSARVRYVTGEFNARYSREFDAPPSFVEVVPAMELYLPGWMRYTVGD